MAGAVEYTASLQRGKTPHPKECPGYDTKQFDDEAPVMLELWEMRSTSSLLLLAGLLWLGVIAPDSALSMGQIELFDIQTECKQMTYPELDC